LTGPASDGDLGRQVERCNLFVHTVLAEQALRANENEAMLNGLVDYLIGRGLVRSDELLQAVESARAEAAEAGELATVGVAIRIDGDEASTPPVLVDCEKRLPICKAVCCRLRFALSAEEIESRTMKWDLGRPYFNRRDSGGYCHQIDGATLGCGVYEDRPCVCRRYSCAHDERIWKDFDGMELNQEWIDANLGEDGPTPIDILMDVP
jgi:Fe-S-cluster containining protein